MKFYVITAQENVLHSYLSRVYGALRITNTSYFPVTDDVNAQHLVSICKGVVEGTDVSIKKATIPFLENMPIVDYARLLFK